MVLMEIAAHLGQMVVQAVVVQKEKMLVLELQDKETTVVDHVLELMPLEVAVEVLAVLVE
jgi:hypothetical protein